MDLQEHPPEPPRNHPGTYYRGWECGFDQMAHDWGGAGWRAYRGGVDIGATCLDASEWEDLLGEIDDWEDGE